MARTSFLVGAVLLLTACASAGQAALPSTHPSASAPPVITTPSATGTPIVGVSPTAPPGAQRVAGGCGNAPAYKGAIPPWASENAPAFLPYVIATPDLAMGYLFSYPLHSGPDGNKILWYVRAPRDGQPLIAEGHPVGAAQPVVQFNKPADSSPGEIYPSGVTVPIAGCWRFHLMWNGNTADVDLLFD